MKLKPIKLEQQLTADHATGCADNHVVAIGDKPQPQLHAASLEAFLLMQQAALAAGHDLQVASGFRSFERQRAIWNRKFAALRAESPATSAADIIASIMRWSALPGTSRHHWGSDLDIYDQSAMRGNALQLEPWEYQADGPCYPLWCWLQQHAHEFGFYWPYDVDRKGVAPEPWHLSHWPVANQLQPLVTPAAIKKALNSAPIEGQQAVMTALPDLLAQYVSNVAPSPTLD